MSHTAEKLVRAPFREISRILGHRVGKTENSQIVEIDPLDPNLTEAQIESLKPGDQIAHGVAMDYLKLGKNPRKHRREINMSAYEIEQTGWLS